MKGRLFITVVLWGLLVIYLGSPPPVYAQEELRVDQKAVAKAIEVKRRHEHGLMGIPGVVGAGVGLSQETGQVVIEVYVEKQTPDLQRTLPRALEGVPVKMVVTGKIYTQ